MVIRTNLINLLLSMLPLTRFFSLKARCLRFLGFFVGENTCITGDVKFYGYGKFSIGANSWLGIGCKFYISTNAEVIIGDNCDIAPDVKFVTGSHKIGAAERRAGSGYADNIYIGSGSWIGIGTILLPGVVLGEATVVAAGAVVTEGKYPANVLLAGVPAKVVKIFEP